MLEWFNIGKSLLVSGSDVQLVLIPDVVVVAVALALAEP
jgi:hypothetical protein